MGMFLGGLTMLRICRNKKKAYALRRSNVDGSALGMMGLSHRSVGKMLPPREESQRKKKKCS